MNRSEYMFVKYKDRKFPVSVSVQNGRKTLAFLHFHEEVEILKVTNGIVKISVGTSVLKCYKDDILLFPPNTLHQVISETDNAEVIAITYKEDLLKIPVEWSIGRGSFRVFNKINEHFEKLNDIFMEAVLLEETSDITFELEMTACLLKLTAIFAKDEIVVSGKSRGSEQRILPALEYIRENICEPIKLSELAEVLYVSKEHMIRLFKATTGKTPMEYITDSKIQKAMSMLEENICSASEISEKLSFANPSHFSKIFRQKLGMTPSEYRKKHLNDSK